MPRTYGLVVLMILGLSMTAMIGCPGPEYPKCEKNDHCAKDSDGKEISEVCVFGQCQECGKDTDCTDGKVCKNYRCEAVCEADTECGDGLSCFDGECKSECDEASGGCSEAQNCQKGRCVTAAAPCVEDGDCDIGFRCATGICTEGVAAASDASKECGQHARIFFQFNEVSLKEQSRETIEKFAECLQGHPDWNLMVEGHADERGTTEYNLALGEKRARAVAEYLKNLGIPLERLKLLSYGEERPLKIDSDEDSWAENRRSELIVQ